MLNYMIFTFCFIIIVLIYIYTFYIHISFFRGSASSHRVQCRIEVKGYEVVVFGVFVRCQKVVRNLQGEDDFVFLELEFDQVVSSPL